MLFQNYEALCDQVQTLRQLVADKLGLPAATEPLEQETAPVQPLQQETAPAEPTAPAAALPRGAPGAPAPGTPAWERWIQLLDVEVQSSKARLGEALARSKARAQGSVQQLQEEWARGLDNLQGTVSSLAPALGSRRG